MSDKLPFEAGGLPQDDATAGLPFAPSAAAPPFSPNEAPAMPFSVEDAAFPIEGESTVPSLPFSLDFEDPAPFPFAAQAAALPFSMNAEPQELPPFAAESQAPALPFSLDAEPIDAPPFAAESQAPALPFSLDAEPIEAPPFAEAAPALEVPAEPAAGPELTGAGFLFEEGEIDSPFFKRLAQASEPTMPKMPPMNVPAMPSVAKPAPAAEQAPPPPPPFPPAYSAANQAAPPPPASHAATPPSRPMPPAASTERPSPPPPPPGYQPPPMPTAQVASPPPAMAPERPTPPPVANIEAPAPYAPPAVADLNAYEPMIPPPASRAPILTGDAVPTHAAPPVAKDVSSALAAMKARLATSRQSQPDPNAGLLKEVPAEAAMDMSLAPKSSKPPEIWEYRVGQSIFREGELTYELFMLMEGILDIYVGGDKVATLNAEFAAGAYLGEIGALLRLPRTATVKAVTSCKFLVFPDAKRLFEEDPEFGIKLSIILAQRLAQSNERMEMVMRALYRAKVKDDVIGAVKGAFQGKESTFIAKKGWFG